MAWEPLQVASHFAMLLTDKLETRMVETAERHHVHDPMSAATWMTVWWYGHMDMRVSKSSLSTALRDCTARGDPVTAYTNMKIAIDLNNRLVYEPFQKLSDSGVSLNFESSVPQHQKQKKRPSQHSIFVERLRSHRIRWHDRAAKRKLRPCSNRTDSRAKPVSLLLKRPTS